MNESSANTNSGVMGSFGNQMFQARYGGKAGPRSRVAMMAGAATVEGDTAIEQKEDHMDKVFPQKKYDNADHLDPVLHYTGNKYVEELMTNAKRLAAPGKGILASDESNGTCGKRFEAINVENTE